MLAVVQEMVAEMPSNMTIKQENEFMRGIAKALGYNRAYRPESKAGAIDPAMETDLRQLAVWFKEMKANSLKAEEAAKKEAEEEEAAKQAADAAAAAKKAEEEQRKKP